VLRAEEMCRGGEEEGASGCPLADTVHCVSCDHEWKPEDVAVVEACPSCRQRAATVNRCESCAVNEVQYYREHTATGQLLERVLEHDFDAEHYGVDPGSVPADLREGLKIFRNERFRWEKETREKAEQRREEQRRLREMQQRR